MPPRGATVSKEIFFAAIANENIHSVRSLIDSVNINVQDAQGNTPLLVALSKNNNEIINLILQKNPDVNKENNIGTTPLVLAASKGLLGIVRKLLDARAEINKESGYETTALMSAAINGHTHIANLLIERGADIEKTNTNKDTALILAASYGRLEIVKSLILVGAKLNKQNKDRKNTALLAAILGMKLAVAKELILAGAKLDIENISGETALTLSVVYDSPNSDYIVKLLIRKGANVNIANRNNETPLLIASRLGYVDKVKYLLNAGADVNREVGVNVDDDEANLNMEDQFGMTALEAASSRGHIEIIKLLLEKDPILTDRIKESIEAGYYTQEVTALLKEHYESGAENKKNAEKWKGFYRSDIEKLNTIFDEANGRDYSFCPVCLKYIYRTEACNYMHHNCSSKGYYNKKLYNKYKNREGDISWCTVCGRICAGHYHYPLVSTDEQKPRPLIFGRSDPFEKDCRVSNGGGGLPEKIARIRQFRETALRLQGEIGKITEDEAMDTLVKETWNAPLSASTEQIEKIEREKNWNIKNTNFPANVAPVEAAAATLNTGNDPTQYSVPKVLSPGSGAAATNRNEGYEYNSVSYVDNVPLIVFTHKDKDGNDHVHPQISKDSVLDYIMKAELNGGKCFDVDCGGLFYPREIEMAFADPKIASTITDEDREKLEKYKVWFSQWRAENAKKGGYTRHNKRRLSKKTRKAPRK